MADLDDLAAKVQAGTTVEASVVILCEGVAAKIEAAKSDPKALESLSSQLKSSTLAADVTSNTPAGEPVAPKKEKGA